jgi:acid phosphatase
MVDNMFPNPNCYRLRHLSKQFTKTVSNMFQERFIKLSDKLKNYVDGVSLNSHPSANGIMDTLIAAKVHGFKLPKEFDDETMLELEDTVVKEWFYGHTQSQEMRRLGLGRLMGTIRDRMMRRAESTDNVIDEDKLKLAVYSGHDT